MQLAEINRAGKCALQRGDRGSCINKRAGTRPIWAVERAFQLKKAGEAEVSKLSRGTSA